MGESTPIERKRRPGRKKREGGALPAVAFDKTRLGFKWAFGEAIEKKDGPASPIGDGR